MYIGGLDIGTSGCKIVLCDEKGNFVKKAYTEYDVSRTNGQHELDADNIWESVKKVIKEVACEDIAAIAVTSFGETFAMLDENDTPCAPSMLYTDCRGKEECESLTEHFGKEKIAQICGAKPHEMYSVSKIMWIKKNMPDAYKKAKHILLMEDYIIYKLSGKCFINYALASRTLCFDIRKKEWSKDILDYCGIDKALLSTPVQSGNIAGDIKEEVAKELGLSKTLKVVNGCHDQIAAMTGSGVFDSSKAMDGTGTVECVPIVMDEPPKNYDLYEYGYSFAPHINGKYACYVLSYAGGATLKWFKNNFSDLSYKEMDKHVSDAPSGLLLLPHFAGAATPYMDISATAAVLGLTFEHTKYDLYKALMEGTAFEMLLNLEIIKKEGMFPNRLVATGGGANSDVWLQIKADILGVEIEALEGEEIGAMGTVFVAGKALGIYENNANMIKMRKIFYPDMEKNKEYRKLYAKYEKMYDAVKSVMK